MRESRLETFKKYVEKDPDNSFARYSMAMEYRTTGDLAMALRTFEELVERDPAYVPAYLMAGHVAAALGETEKAEAVLARGIEAAAKAGNQHAASEMSELLESLR